MANSKKTSPNPKESKRGRLPSLSAEERRFNDLYANAIDQRRKSCYLGGLGTDNSSATGDWEDLWEIQDKFAIMHFSGSTNSGQSNIKSPEIAGRIQSTIQKLSKVNLEFVARPLRPEAKFAAEVAQLVVNTSYRKNKYKARLGEAFYDALRHGSAPMQVDFLYRKRKVHMPVTDSSKMTKEEREELKESKKVPHREVTIIDKRDVVLRPRRIQEIYYDPSARQISGDDNYASYYFDTSSMPYDKFMHLYKDKAGYKNINKVMKLSDLADGRYEDNWFTPPQDMEGDYVHIVKMWDYDNDRYMERANDIFILESPLPYNHKKLNIVQFTPLKLPEQIYGIGVADFLIPIVNSIEMLQNQIVDYVGMTTNPILMVEKGIYNEFSRYYRSAQPGLMIPVMDVNRAVAPLKYMPLSMDVFQVLTALQRDAVIASQHDPSQLGVISKNATATANIINKEIVDAYVGFVLSNFVETLNEVGSMVLSLHHQFLTQKDVYEMLNDDMEVEDKSEYRQLAIDDMDIEIDWDSQTLKMVDSPGKTSYLEMSPKLFTYKDEEGNETFVTPDDIRVELTAESVEIVSKALQIQKSKENFAQLAGYMVDPSDRAKVASHPAPYVDGPSFLEEYFEINGLNKKHLIKTSERIEKDTKHAMEQNKMMFNLERPIPEAGMGREHLKVHEDFLSSVKKIRDDAIKEAESAQQAMMQSGMPGMMPQGMGGMMPQGMNGMMQQGMGPAVPQLPQAITEKIQRLGEVIAIASEHIQIDSLPAWQRTDSVIAQAQPGASGGMAGGMGGGTMVGGNAGNMGGGNAPMPNMPRGAGYSQGGGGQLGGFTGQTQQ